MVTSIERIAGSALAGFYTNFGVDPKIAQEFAPMAVKNLAGLGDSMPQTRIDPDLGELQTEFISLVQNGFEPSACAILLAAKPFQLAYWNGRPTDSHFTTRIGEAIGRRYRESIGGGEDPIAVARDLVLKTQEYQGGLKRLFNGGLTSEERAGIKELATRYEGELEFRQGK